MFEKKGIVNKVQKATYKSSNRLILTDKGKKIFRKIELFNKMRRNKILKNFSPEDKNKVIALLDALIAATLSSSTEILLT